MAIIAKNNTATKILISDLGIAISASDQRDLTEVFRKEVIAASNDLLPLVASEDITINDGKGDLNISDGLKQITIQTEWEDEEVDKVKTSINDSTASYLIDKIEGELGSVVVTKKILGGNETLNIKIDPAFIGDSLKTVYSSDDTLSTTTLRTWQTKLTLVVPAYTGLIRIGYTMEFNANANNKQVEVRMHCLTDVLDVGLSSQSTNASTNYFSFSGFHYELFTGTSHTYALQFRQVTGACTVKNAELESWRVGS